MAAPDVALRRLLLTIQDDRGVFHRCHLPRFLLDEHGDDAFVIAYEAVTGIPAGERLSQACLLLLGLTEAANGAPPELLDRCEEILASPRSTPLDKLLAGRLAIPAASGEVYFETEPYYSRLEQIAGTLAAVDWSRDWPATGPERSLFEGSCVNLAHHVRETLDWISRREETAYRFETGAISVERMRLLGCVTSPDSPFPAIGYTVGQLDRLEECVVRAAGSARASSAPGLLVSITSIPHLGEYEHFWLNCSWQAGPDDHLEFKNCTLEDY